jgi:hypothetical protein
MLAQTALDFNQRNIAAKVYLKNETIIKAMPISPSRVKSMTRSFIKRKWKHNDSLN